MRAENTTQMIFKEFNFETIFNNTFFKKNFIAKMTV